jgi:hypothetical protein
MLLLLSIRLSGASAFGQCCVGVGGVVGTLERNDKCIKLEVDFSRVCQILGYLTSNSITSSALQDYTGVISIKRYYMHINVQHKAIEGDGV